MASIKLLETKNEQRVFRFSVSRGHGKTPYTMRWRCPSTWAMKTAEREARKAAAEFERRCKAGDVLNREQKKEKAAQEAAEAAKLKTFKTYANGIFMAKKRQKLTENGRASYEMYFDRHIFPVIGDFLLVEITPAMIDKLIDDYQQNHAHASTIKLWNILNGVFKMAAKDDSIAINPMTKLDRPTPRHDEAPKEESEKAYSAEELSRILQCIDGEPLKWRTYVHLMADTGLRRGECCGLQWSDIDFRENFLTIRHNLQYTAAAGVFDKRPKNKKVRIVDIGPDIADLLRQLREEQAQKAISKWVFSQDGSSEPMHPQSPTRYFKKLERRYDIKDFHPHRLRHTSVSVSLLAGADLASVSERAGHSNPAVTARIYAHSNQEGIRRAGQLAREALKKPETDVRQAEA